MLEATAVEDDEALAVREFREDLVSFVLLFAFFLNLFVFFLVPKFNQLVVKKITTSIILPYILLQNNT